MLAEHPEVLKRLRKEILEKVGSYRRPEYEDLREMKYLRAVINGACGFLTLSNLCSCIQTETLRLYPIV